MQAVVNEQVDDAATRAELLAQMASAESVADVLGASLIAKNHQLSGLQSVLHVRWFLSLCRYYNILYIHLRSYPVF